MILLGPCDSCSYLLLYADSVLSKDILDLLQGIRRQELSAEVSQPHLFVLAFV